MPPFLLVPIDWNLHLQFKVFCSQSSSDFLTLLINYNFFRPLFFSTVFSKLPQLIGALLRTIYLVRPFFCEIATCIFYIASFNELFVFQTLFYCLYRPSFTHVRTIFFVKLQNLNLDFSQKIMIEKEAWNQSHYT